MSSAADTTIPVHNTCPWPKQQVKIMVKQAIDNAGGRSGFDFVGPAIRRAIIVEACWRAIACQHSTIAMTPDCIRSIERSFCEAAGIWDDE